MTAGRFVASLLARVDQVHIARFCSPQSHISSRFTDSIVGMNRRESTNYKLAAIINAKDNDQDEEAAVLNEEQKAKQRLRRSSLYGGGAR